jgi:cation:H+ antiporter
MTIFFLIIALIVLFCLMGRVADIAVVSVKRIAHRLGVPLLFAGVLLGLFTSSPEFTVGISSMFLQNVPDIGIGDLLGGTIVVFGLILGLSLLFEKKIKTDGNLAGIFPIMLVVFLPFLVFLPTGNLGLAGGVVLIAGYCLALWKVYKLDGKIFKHKGDKNDKPLGHEVLTIVISLIAMLVIAELTVRTAVSLLTILGVAPFVIGLFVFPIGTNLPELIIVFVAWKKHIRDLSFGNLLGSAMANTPILGFFAIMHPLHVEINNSYLFLLFSNAILLLLVGWFYETDKKLTRNEGMALIALYAVFVVTELYLMR